MLIDTECLVDGYHSDITRTHTFGTVAEEVAEMWETVLRPGMCFSNEPMIVVPDRSGIRREDHFHATRDGAQWFTQPQRALERPFE